MKRAKKIFGCMIVAIGLVLAIETMNESNYEVALRFGGTVLIALGAYLAEAFDFQTKKGGAR